MCVKCDCEGWVGDGGAEWCSVTLMLLLGWLLPSTRVYVWLCVGRNKEYKLRLGFCFLYPRIAIYFVFCAGWGESGRMELSVN